MEEASDLKDKNTFKYKLVKKIGVVAVNSKGWTKEVNLISYNGKKSAIDIRRWSPTKKMSKGITFKKEELPRLIDLLTKIYDNETKEK